MSRLKICRTVRFVMVPACLLVLGASHLTSLATPTSPLPVKPQRVAESSPLALRLDAMVREGFDRPDRALRQLDALAAHGSSPEDARRMLLARGLILAEDGQDEAATAIATRLRAEGEPSQDPTSSAGEALVLAAIAQQQGQVDAGAARAEAALEALRRLCRSDAHLSACDYRNEWLALQIVAEAAYANGNTLASQARWQQAYDLSLRMGDGYRQALSLSQLAANASDNGDLTLARRLAARATRLARQVGEASALARVKLAETNIADPAAPADEMLTASLEGSRLARLADSPRLEARFLLNVSDYYVKHHRPRDALAAIDRALPVVRLHRDRGDERLLLHNATLAHIGLRQMEKAKAAIDAMRPGWEEGGGLSMQAMAWRELSEAFAAAGDFSDAVALYHRERRLAADIVARNRVAVLEELQGRSERDRQQRSIELLERDNALQAIELSDQLLTQRMWAAVAAAVLLVLGLTMPLVRKAHRAKLHLTVAQAELRKRSERDPLTGLANRRSFNDQMTLRSLAGRFEGALLLIDLDHFKRINDAHGHAAGDAVLVEVGRRLRDTVRRDDFVTRWGGEEFLVFAPDVHPEQLDALASRLLQVVSGTPVRVDGKTLHLTASIGYSGFPLPPNRVPTKVEQAVNIVDLALYRAKRQGRNAAVCVASAAGAVDSQTLGDLALQFDAAAVDGRLELRTMPGSQLRNVGTAS